MNKADVQFKKAIETVLEEGVTPSAPVTNIGTSEKLKTATINADPSKVY